MAWYFQRRRVQQCSMQSVRLVAGNSQSQRRQRSAGVKYYSYVVPESRPTTAPARRQLNDDDDGKQVARRRLILPQSLWPLRRLYRSRVFADRQRPHGSSNSATPVPRPLNAASRRRLHRHGQLLLSSLIECRPNVMFLRPIISPATFY